MPYETNLLNNTVFRPVSGTLSLFRNMSKYNFTSRILLLTAGLLISGLFSSFSLRAQGDLMVFPKRLVFEGAVKTAELNLANIGKDTARYNISFVQYRMNEDGSFTEIKTPDEGQNFADKFLRYYPRSIVLAPKESQIVKVQLSKPSQMEPGEYRSHIYFRAIPNARPLGEEEKKDTTTVSVRLVPVFGITIPTIIRVGESTTKVSLSDLDFSIRNDTLPVISLKFNRSGNMSVYGDLSVSYISPAGRKTEVGRANGVAVYTPNPARKFQVALLKNSTTDYRSGKLHVEYTSPTDAKPMKYAEADLLLK
jgi:P pilus assembly chaperone PapD